MFGKKSTKQQNLDGTNEEKVQSEKLHKGYNPPKGGATPKRKVVEARNRHPLISGKVALTKEEKKERKREERRRSDEIYRRQQEAMRTGDEANMPYQHRGKVRRWGRDYIDASGPIASWFIPLAFLIIPLMALQGYFPSLTLYLTLFLYIMFLAMAGQAIYLGNKAKKIARQIFGVTQVPRGFAFQLVSRCFYPRRWRLPKPMTERGKYPAGAKKKIVGGTE